MNVLPAVSLRAMLSCLLTLLLLSLTARAAPPTAANGPMDDLITIGLAAPLSGVAEAFGKSFFQAAQVAVDQANEAGLSINGRRVTFTLVPVDDRGDARAARLVAQYLIRRNVAGVVGHGMTAPSLAAAQLYAEAGIPMITGSASSKELTEQGYQNVFRTIGHDDNAALQAATYMRQVFKSTRAVTLDDGSAFGMRMARQFAKAFSDSAGIVLARATVNDKTSDFNAVLNPLKGQPIDVVFFGGSVRQAAELLLTMRRIGMGARLLTGSNGTADTPFLEFAGLNAEGTLAIEPGIPPQKLPGWKAFSQAYASRGDAPMTTFTPYVYDATQVLIAAIRAAGSAEPARVAQALHAIRMNGLTGRIAFDDQGNLLDPRYTIYEVRQGHWVAQRQTGIDR